MYRELSQEPENKASVIRKIAKEKIAKKEEKIKNQAQKYSDWYYNHAFNSIVKASKQGNFVLLYKKPWFAFIFGWNDEIVHFLKLRLQKDQFEIHEMNNFDESMLKIKW